jgi:hypothetical protein
MMALISFTVDGCRLSGIETNAITRRWAKISPMKTPTSAAITIRVEMVCEIYSTAIINTSAATEATIAAIIAVCNENWKKNKPENNADVTMNNIRIIAIIAFGLLYFFK